MKIKIKDTASIQEDTLISNLAGTIWEAKLYKNDKVIIDACGGIVIEKDEYEIVN